MNCTFIKLVLKIIIESNFMTFCSVLDSIYYYSFKVKLKFSKKSTILLSRQFIFQIKTEKTETTTQHNKKNTTNLNNTALRSEQP